MLYAFHQCHAAEPVNARLVAFGVSKAPRAQVVSSLTQETPVLEKLLLVMKGKTRNWAGNIMVTSQTYKR